MTRGKAGHVKNQVTNRDYDSLFSHLSDDAGILNDYAWHVYEKKLTGCCRHAITCAERAVQRQPGKCFRFSD